MVILGKVAYKAAREMTGKKLEPMKKAFLEDISDKIRHGIPIGICDAIAAIEYQTYKRNHGVRGFINRFIRRVKGGDR